jgi:peptidylprolyl isomerase
MKKKMLLAVLAISVLSVSCLTGGVMNGSRVKAHYTLTVDGKVFDTSRGGEPFEFQVGSRQVVPGFEKGVIWMKVGEIKSFQVSPEEGYGLEDPNGIQTVSKAMLPPGLELKEGMTIPVAGAGGRRFQVRVVEVREDAVVINQNHPLAGKTLDFEVEILEIR